MPEFTLQPAAVLPPRRIRLPYAALLTILAVACGGDSGTGPVAPPPPPPPPPAVASVLLDRTAVSLATGGRVQLTATARDAAGQVMGNAGVTWSSSGSAASVTPQGLVSAVSAGSATITATSGSAAATAAITVLEGTPGVTTVTPSASVLLPGDTVALAVRSFDANGVAATAVQWSSSNPQAVVVDNAGRAAAVAAGSAIITGTTSAGSASAAVQVEAPVAASAIAASKTAVCALNLEGRLFCAGEGYGSAPVAVAPALRFAFIDGFGDRLTAVSGFCAIDADAAAYCWGSNGSGQLGTGDDRNYAQPWPVAGGLRFRSLSTSDFHTCGVTTSGEAYCWGEGRNGQLGRGDTLPSNVPVRVQLERTVTQVSTGQGVSCALTQEGEIFCWGLNRTGQVGDGSVPVNATTPRRVTAGVQFSALNRRHTNFVCALSTTGAPYCWGNTNPMGTAGVQCPLPEGGTHGCWPVPTSIGTSITFTSLVANAVGGMCGITVDRKVACWGLNTFDRFGVQGTCAQGCLLPQPGLSGYLSVNGSVYTNCGIRQDGVPFCWGSNEQGQFGVPAATTGPFTARPTRFRIPG